LLKEPPRIRGIVPVERQFQPCEVDDGGLDEDEERPMPVNPRMVCVKIFGRAGVMRLLVVIVWKVNGVTT
jgi:hypothetical protein